MVVRSIIRTRRLTRVDISNTADPDLCRPATSQLSTPALSQGKASPQLVAHPCLHLLSPKAEPLARASSENAIDVTETLRGAVDFGWLVPMMERGDSRSGQAANNSLTISVPSPTQFLADSTPNSSRSMDSPAATSMASTPSSASHSSAGMASMHRTQSFFSTSSKSTAATSAASSIMSRKRQSGTARYFGSTKEIRLPDRSASMQNLRRDSTRSTMTLSSLPEAERTVRASVSMVQIRSAPALPPRRVPPRTISAQRKASRTGATPMSPSGELMRLWAQAEELERINRAPVVKSPTKISQWLGALTKSSKKADKAQPTAAAFDSVREPRVLRKTRSISQMLD